MAEEKDHSPDVRSEFKIAPRLYRERISASNLFDLRWFSFVGKLEMVLRLYCKGD